MHTQLHSLHPLVVNESFKFLFPIFCLQMVVRNFEKIMMEVEHISYIFGSFTRRRQSQEVGPQRSSSQPTKISHDRSKSAPHTSKQVQLPLPRAKSVCNYILDHTKFKCSLCRNLFIEPRVLPCLHTFCTACLRKLASNSTRFELQGKLQRCAARGVFVLIIFCDR